METVTKVIKSDSKILEKLPPLLQIDAEGEVPTSGWTDGKLEPRVYIVNPPDGIQDFDFTAEPPQGPASDVVSAIKASATIHFQEWMKGYRIHAKEGSHEVIFKK